MPTGASEDLSEKRWERRRRAGRVGLLLLLVPLAVPAGLFAPNFVAAVRAASALLPGGDDRESDALLVELDHEPLRFPRRLLFSPQSVTPAQTRSASLGRLLRPAPPRSTSISSEA